MADSGGEDESFHNYEVEPVIEVVEAPQDEEVVQTPVVESYDPELLPTTVPPPIRLRGIGATTVFGLSSRIEDTYPAQLSGRVAPEEFQATIGHVNGILQKQVPLSLKCLLFGCFCCCCTAGLSLGPSIVLNRTTKYYVEKTLKQENSRLYNRLGLNWSLVNEVKDGVYLREYVILIEFLPKLPLLWPD